MGDDVLSRLLAGRLADPDGPGNLAVPTRRVVIGDSLAGRELGLVEACGFGHRLAVIADPATHRAIGARVVQALRAEREVDLTLLPEHPYADKETVDSLKETTSGASAVIAIGSGTINDLCKYSAHRAGKPYAVFATAPSMNGYTSTNASIAVAGHKKTLPAAPPVAAFFDLDVLRAAPLPMRRAGFGDSICRVTAEADWLLAHLLLDQAYRKAPFMLVAEDEPTLLANPEGLVSGDVEVVRALVRVLILSGFGMTLCGSSHPASEGEHLIGHYLEMMGDPAWPRVLHGEQIAVTTLTMARIQEGILAHARAPEAYPNDPDEAAILAHFGPEIGPSCWDEFKAKRLDAARASLLSRRLAERWPEIRSRIGAVIRPARTIADTLRRVGAPMRAADIGVPAEAYRRAVLRAREIRNRYTFLDLAANAELLEGLSTP